jgi:hypothetical protein
MENQATAPALRQRISALRGALRAALLLHGLSLVCSAFLWTALILAVGDYFFHFPGILRLILLIAVLAATAYLLWRDVAARLLRPIPDQFLAGVLQNTASLRHEQLQTAVEFMENRTDRLNVLAAKAILDANETAQSVQVGAALSWQPVLRLGLAAALALLVAALIIGLNPRNAALSLQRWAGPLGHHPWPLAQHVEMVWKTADGRPPAIWPEGQALTLRAMVKKGFSPALRVWLEVRRGHEPIDSQLMTWQGAGHGQLYEKVLLPEGKTIQVRPMAGDDHREAWVTIDLMPRPRIVAITATIAPPEYAPHAPTYHLNVLDRRVSVIRGSVITLKFSADQPLHSGSAVFSFVNAVRATPISLAAHIVRRTADSMTLRWIAEKSISGRLRVVNSSGLANRRGGLVQISVRPDALPTVAISRPRHSVELTPDGSFHLTIQGSDDLGLTRLLLKGTSTNIHGKASHVSRNTPLAWQSLAYDAQTRLQEGTTTTRWSPANLHLVPGDTVELAALAGDNYRKTLANGAVRHHALVQSAPLLVMIRARQAIEAELRADLQSVRRAIKALLLRQQNTAQQTAAIRQSIKSAGKATAQQQAALSDLTARQAEEAARADQITRTLGHINRIARRNKLDQSTAGKLAALAADKMGDVGQINMPAAAANLTRGDTLSRRKSPSAAGQAARALEHAGLSQQQAIETMRALLNTLGAQGEFDSLVAKTRKMLQQQQLLQNQLKALAAKTIGMNMNQLPAALQHALRQLSQKQNMLAGKAAKLESQLQQAAAAMKQANPALSAALAQAAKIAQGEAVSSSMHMAAGAISNNQMQSGSANQGRSHKGLADMLKALNSARNKSLNQLAKQLRELIGIVAQLIIRQKGLIARTTHAGAHAPETALAGAANLESRLQLDTLSAAGKADTVDQSGKVGGLLRAGGGAMGRATGSLLRDHQPHGLTHENSALGDLQQALALLQKQLQKVLNKQKQNQIASLKKQYQLLLKAQQSLLDQTRTLRESRVAQGILNRPQQLQALGIARAEQLLIAELAALSQVEAGPAPLLAWLNGKIINDMRQAAQQMAGATVNQSVLDEQSSAIAKIKDIIDALKQQQKSGKSGGGGGGGGGGKQQLMPPAAQLKLLKLLQLQVNADSAFLNNQLQHTKTPAQRRSLRTIVRHLGGMQSDIATQAQHVVQSMKK